LGAVKIAHCREIPMPRPKQEIRFCTSRDGTRIAYAICGSGPPLLWMQHWVHHLDGDWESPIWVHWLSRLTRNNTLIRYDYRGCGLSDRDVEYSFDKLCEDFEAVVAATGATRFALITMGGAAGAIAAQFIVRNPDRVSHLVLYAPFTHNRLAGNPTPDQIEEVRARLKVIELGWPNENPAYGQFFTTLHAPDANPEQLRSYNDLLRSTTTPRNAVALLGEFQRADARETLPNICCPTLVLHCRSDAVLPFQRGRAVAGVIPGARFVPLESRNHLVQEQEPAWRRLVEALDDFLPGSLATDETSFDDLTEREREILDGVAQGLSNGAIAEKLRISEKTVRNQVSIVFSKLSVNSRAEAIVRARDAGFGRSKQV
jgi:pimeloyl-ACP methyl ester carboxylesterase/DNA-binding CsgD family transcriptional regulator